MTQDREQQSLLSDLCVMTMDAFRGVLVWDGACVYRVNEDGTAFGHHLFQMPTEQLSLYRKQLSRHDPLNPARFRMSTMNVIPLEIAQRDFDSRVYVDTFLNAFNFPYEVELFFRDARNQIVAGLGLFRSPQSGRFRMAELELLDRVRPIAECGFRLMSNSPPDRASTLTRSYGLTKRESEVIDLVRRGASNREISGLLGIAVATVKRHLFNAFEKTGVSSRTEMISRLYLHN